MHTGNICIEALHDTLHHAAAICASLRLSILAPHLKQGAVQLRYEGRVRLPPQRHEGQRPQEQGCCQEGGQNNCIWQALPLQTQQLDQELNLPLGVLCLHRYYA